MSSGCMRAPPNLSREQWRVRDSEPWRRTGRSAVPSGMPPERGEGELVVRRCLGAVCDAGRGGAAPAPASSADLQPATENGSVGRSAAAASSRFSPQSRLGAGVGASAAALASASHLRALYSESLSES